MNPRPDPAVSLIFVTYNQERYVDDALASVVAQTSDEFEVVIIDDASTDNTVKRIRDWLAQLPPGTQFIVNDRNQGLCANKNLGLAHARGEFVCGLSGDDSMFPDRFARELAFFRTLGPEVGVVFTDALLIADDGVPVGFWFHRARRFAEGRIFDALLRGNFIPAPTTMIRRSAIDAVGGYDESLLIEDFDMWLRIADRFEFRFLADRLMRYRLSPGGMSRDPALRADMKHSEARTLLKWYGRAPQSDAYIREEAWALGRRVTAVDPSLGRPLLRDVYALAPSRARWLQLRLAELPGVPRLMLELFRLHDRRVGKAPMRRPGDGRTATGVS